MSLTVWSTVVEEEEKEKKDQDFSTIFPTQPNPHPLSPRKKKNEKKGGVRDDLPTPFSFDTIFSRSFILKKSCFS